MQVKGRGAVTNPTHRFASLQVEADPDYLPDEDDIPVGAKTKFWDDQSRSILSRNQSPDIPFEASLNPYRGCEHGCAYCYARPTHEYLGHSAGLDFESQIFVKRTAPELLRKELSKNSWRPQVLALSGITDCYQPVERKLKITRGCLEVLLEFGNPVSVITKNFLITRDCDLLSQMAQKNLVQVNLSITTLDPELARLMEPRGASPELRLKAVELLSQAGIPVTVMAAPIVPGLTDHELPEILRRAAEAGARRGGYIPLRLPGAVADVFQDWLSERFPLRKEKIIARICELRGGRLNDPNFHTRFTGVGKAADNLNRLYAIALKRAGLENERCRLSLEHFRVPQPAKPRQLGLFE
ncbi:MAG: PA0069 family radical SAM protein [Candidatus Eremiobacteraeota bacterium]|nr:PA0069 family radical SAM protein [Candidatus Eremiobacteraeota bacterium]MCW5868791.1 PA0069 family radical SAM protein [Candidatus Eremiobacteraeota bacterium]